MTKRTVRYRGEAIPLLGKAFLTPIDHPDTANVTNTKPVLTSIVTAWDEATGRIETQHTVYVPEGV